jgi:peptide/nickel transport system substrate-binding protein
MKFQVSTNRKRRAFVERSAAALLAAGMLSACTKIDTASSRAGGGNSWTVPGRLIYAEAADVKSLNPMLATSAVAGDLSMFIFSYAVRYDDHARPIPDALRELPTVENGDVSRDGLTLKYKLRPNIYFHDNVRLTCRDLAFTWKAVMNPANNDITQDGYKDIKDIDCHDPLVALIHMKRVYAPFLQQLWGLNGNAPILPAHLLEKYNDSKGSFNTAAYQSAPVGSGPFSFVSWSRASQVELKAFDRYFLGKPKLRTVIYKIVPDDSTMVDELKTHEIDMAVRVGSNVWPQLQNIPGVIAREVPEFAYSHIDFNLKRPLFADARVRRALAMAIDRKSILAKIAHGLGDLTDTALSPKNSWAWTNDTAHYDYDPAKAAALLDAAGWKVGPDGIRTKNGQRLAFNFSTQTESRNGKAIEADVQAMWHDIGADVAVKNTPTAQFFDNTANGILQGGHYDVAAFSWVAAADPDDSAIYSAHNMAPRGQNALFWNDPAVTAAMDDELATVDRARRLRDFKLEQQHFAGDVPSIVLYYLREAEAYNSDLKGYTPSPVVSPFWNPQEYSI